VGLFSTTDAAATNEVMRELSLRSGDLTPSQKGAVWSLRIWLALIDPLLRIGAFIVAIAVMIRLMFARVDPVVAMATYAAIAFFGFLGIRYGMERIRRALFARVVRALDLKPSAVGGATPAMLPAIRPRD
jgi:hypothetical protein